MRTRVGYAGGTTPAPTYRRIGDHAEAIEVEYDPASIAYEDLLAVFWKAHDPFRAGIGGQYRAAVFWADEGQRRLAEASRARVAAGSSRAVATAVERLTGFTPAEDYHQKYYLQGVEALAEHYGRIYPDASDFAASTAVARVNGYLGGHGTPERLAADAVSLGLAGEPLAELERIVRRMHPGEACALPAASAR